MSEYNDYPLETIRQSMEKRIREGATCYQKWTCAGCGDRVTAEEPNVLYRAARHNGRVFHDLATGESREDEGVCGAITDIEKQGCNFMFILPVGRS